VIKNYRISAPPEFHDWLEAILLAHVPSNEPVEPEPPDPPSPPASGVEQRLADGYSQMNMSIEQTIAIPKYVVKDIFTTRDGSWEPSSRQYSVTQWARDSYLKPWGAQDHFDDAGGATHLFGAVIGLNGWLLKNVPIRFFTRDGKHEHTARTKAGSGWANMFMNRDSSFNPVNGATGVWCWSPEDAELLCGGGLPQIDGYTTHTSTFCVWQQVP